MQQRLISLATSAALVVALFVAPQAYALPDHSVYYRVYYSCYVGPGDWYGTLQGEWTLACDGNWYGWGIRPYSSCGQIVEEFVGESCGIEPPEGP